MNYFQLLECDVRLRMKKKIVVTRHEWNLENIELSMSNNHFQRITNSYSSPHINIGRTIFYFALFCVKMSTCTASERLPVFYISHGGNFFFFFSVHFLFVILIFHLYFLGPTLLEDKGKPGEFFSWFGNYLKTELKPKAVVIISAHWQGRGKNGIFGNITGSIQCAIRV